MSAKEGGVAKQGETDPDGEQRRGKEMIKRENEEGKEGLGERKGKDWIHHI
jgi:hypothetical protein